MTDKEKAEKEKTTSEWTKREIGALWLRKSRKGQKYLSGHVIVSDDNELDDEDSKVRVIVFSNKDKKNERAPDYRMYRHTPLESQEENSATAENEDNERPIKGHYQGRD